MISKGASVEEENAIKEMMKGKPLPQEIRQQFTVADVCCSKELGRGIPDRESVLSYLLKGNHDRVIDNFHEMYPDFESGSCKAEVGRVIKTYNGYVAVLSDTSLKRCRNLSDAKIGDYVVSHSWSAIGVLSKEEKEKYL
jgi:hydrogenase maturation factor